MQKIFSTAREIAHAAIAVIGALSAASALIVTALDVCGVHITDAQLIQALGVAGGVAVLISKGIDSLNNAVTSTKAVPTAVVSYAVPPTGTGA